MNVTGNGWWGLFRHPAELERLRAEPSLVRTAIEDLMWWDTPLQMFERWVLEDVEVTRHPDPEGCRAGIAVRVGTRDPAVSTSPMRFGSSDTPTRT